MGGDDQFFGTSAWWWAKLTRMDPAEVVEFCLEQREMLKEGHAAFEAQRQELEEERQERRRVQQQLDVQTQTVAELRQERDMAQRAEAIRPLREAIQRAREEKAALPLRATPIPSIPVEEVDDVFRLFFRWLRQDRRGWSYVHDVRRRGDLDKAVGYPVSEIWRHRDDDRVQDDFLDWEPGSGLQAQAPPTRRKPAANVPED